MLMAWHCWTTAPVVSVAKIVRVLRNEKNKVALGNQVTKTGLTTYGVTAYLLKTEELLIIRLIRYKGQILIWSAADWKWRTQAI